MTPRLLCGKAILITVNHITLEDKLVSELLIFYFFFISTFFLVSTAESAVLLTLQTLRLLTNLCNQKLNWKRSSSESFKSRPVQIC